MNPPCIDDGEGDCDWYDEDYAYASVSVAGCPSISRKALSRQKIPVRCVSTACFAREVEDQGSGNSRLHHPLGGKVFFTPPTIDTAISYRP